MFITSWWAKQIIKVVVLTPENLQTCVHSEHVEWLNRKMRQYMINCENLLKQQIEKR